MPTTEQDTQDCVDMVKLASGHDGSLNDLMDRHADRVFRFLVRMLGNEDDGHDLAQETFVRVYRSKGSYNPNKKFTTWLYTIAANLARNQLRWRARHPAVSLDAPGGDGVTALGDFLPTSQESPDGDLQHRERLAAVRVAVQKLPEDLREALVLCEWEEYTMAEAAEVLETTPKAADSRLYRARKQLRTSLGRWIDT